jgi:ferredoxin-NADP reductase
MLKFRKDMISMPSTPDFPKILFMCFIHLTDSENDITAGEVEDFHSLMAAPKWTKRAVLREALPQLQSRYESLWSAYTTKALSINIDAIREHWSLSCKALPADEESALRLAALEFVRNVHQSSPRLRAKSGVANSDGGRSRARAELEQLLGAPVMSVPTPTMPAPKIPSPVPAPKDASARPAGPIKARCVKITPEAPDVKTYTFVPDEPFHFSYKPGQFITLELPIDGHVLRRSYTISSSPTRPHSFAITVKRVPKGWMSNWLHEEMKVGAECMVSGPYGDFSCVDHPADHLLMISGGSGVTPMISMLRFLADTSAPTSIVFINNVRTPADIIFEKELMDLSARFGEALQLGILPTNLPLGQSWPSLVGPWSEAALLALAPDFMERETFVCGPPGYVEMVRGTLEQLGYPMHRFHQEQFGASVAPATPARRSERPPSEPVAAPVAQPMRPEPASPPMVAPSPASPPAETQTEIVFQQSGVTVSCADGDVILDVAEQNGVALSSSCRSGVCGACKIRKTEGVVQMGEQTVLNEWDIADGYVLACLGTAHGRVVVDA